MTLRPCITCSRHVAVVERVCPFCGAELVARSLTPLVVAPGRLTRAAIFAGATLAGTACSSGSPAQTKLSVEQTQESPTQTATPIEHKQAQTGIAAGTISGIAAGTITGVIIRADTAQPVLGVTVRVVGPRGVVQQVRTDATGTYLFTNVAPGDYVLEWTLQPNHPRRQPEDQQIKVDASGGQRVDLTVHIPPPASQNMPYGAPPRRKRIV